METVNTPTNTGDYLGGYQFSTYVQSFKYNEQTNTIEVIFRTPSNVTLAVWPPRPSPDTVWKEIYGVVNGKLGLLKKIDGKHIPPQTIFENITLSE